MMARADLLLKLVTAGTTGDQHLFNQTIEAIVAEERNKHHHVLADRLEKKLRSATATKQVSLTTTNGNARNFLYETNPSRYMEELILPNSVLDACRELIEEQHRSDLLRSYNLQPRHRILLAGPPGNGKTSLAEALATELMLPMFTVRYEGIIGSYLGETASKLEKLFEFIRTNRCILFFDEFDAIGKERGDNHESGEIKRVVSSLLLQIDKLPSHVIVVTATNHPELLDRAVWRRFQLRLSLPKPNKSQIERWFNGFKKKFDEPLGYAPKTLGEKLSGLNFSEIEEFALDIQRRYILSMPNSNLKSIVRERLKQLGERFNIE